MRYSAIGKIPGRNRDKKPPGRSFWVIPAIFLALGTAVQAEALFLQDGRVLYGSIENVSDAGVRFREETGPVRTYPRQKVLRINYGERKLAKKYIYFNNEGHKHAYIVQEDANQIIIREELQDRNEQTISRKKIEVILSQPKQKKFYYTFTYPRKASTVVIEGDFTAWEPVNMELSGKNFERTFPIDILKKSEYQYRILADDAPAERRFIKFKLQNGQLLEDIDLYKWTFGLRIGGGAYLSGPQSNRLTVQQPVTGLVVQGNLPFLIPNLVGQARFDYYNNRPTASNNPKISDYSIDASNLSFHGGVGYEYNFYQNYSLLPKVGFGKQFTSWAINGAQTQSTSTAFYVLTAGFELHFALNRPLDLVMDFQDAIQLEDGARQLFTVSFGVNFRP